MPFINSTTGVVLGTVTWGAATRLLRDPHLTGERTWATGLLDLGVLHTLGAGTNPTSAQMT